MPTPIVRPTNYSLPFANGGTKNTIPTAATGTGKASFTEGFPAVTMQPISAGGIPPEGKDFNGILYDITTHTIFLNAGGQYRFDAALATAIGGYPVGMVLQNNAGTSAYVSAAANNSIDFNSTPSSIGAQWLPWAGFAAATVCRPVGISTSGPVTSNIYLVDTTIAAISLTLPANPALWDTIEFVDTYGTWAVHNMTLLRNGRTIMGYANDLVCNIRGLEFRAIYNGTTWELQ